MLAMSSFARTWWEENWGVVVAPSVIVALVYGFILLLNSMEGRQCREKWAETKMEVKYDFFAGCRILRDGKWYPASAFRVNEKEE